VKESEWGAVPVVTLEQLEVLMLVAGAENPQEMAMVVRRRWRYILDVAKAAAHGRVIDASLPHVVGAWQEYTDRALSILHVVDEWLDEHYGQPLPDAS